jgi:hypothetical protein
MRLIDFLASSGLIGLFLILFGVIALTIPLYMTIGDSLTQSFRAVGNILISTGLLSSFFHLFLRRAMLKQVREELLQIVDADSKRIGVEAIYLNRADLERRLPIDTFLLSAKKDILIVAIGATRIASHYQRVLVTLLNRGVKIRVLIQATLVANGDSEIYSPILNQFASDSGKDADAFRTEIDTPVNYLENLELHLHKPASKRFRILRYSWIPTCSIIVIDGRSKTGTALIELYPYGCEPSLRPSLKVISCNYEQSLYNTLVQQYNLLWQKAELANLD